MRIAIVGAGFLGLACSWQHLQHPNTHVTLFDSKGIGAGASGIATGLLHPFTGKKAELNFAGLEAYADALELIDVAETALGKSVAVKTGVYRPAVTDEQKILFSKTHTKYPQHVEQKDALGHSGIYIHMGMTG